MQSKIYHSVLKKENASHCLEYQELERQLVLNVLPEKLHHLLERLKFLEIILIHNLEKPVK